MKRYGVTITIEEDYEVEAKSTYYKRVIKRFDKRKNMLRFVKRVVKSTQKIK